MTTALVHHGAGVTWTEGNAMARSAHAVLADDRVWLIDPFEAGPALAAAAALGTPAAVIQLLDRHERDGGAIAHRLGVPLLRLPAALPDSPFEVISVVNRRWWCEKALWWPEGRVLVVAEAVGTGSYFRLGRRAGVHPMLRLTPPRRALGSFEPELLLVGHGPPLEGGGGEALRDALRHARGDLPRLALELPRTVATWRS